MMKTTLKTLFLCLFALTLSASYARIGDEQIRNMESSIVIERIDNSDVEVDMPGMVFTFQDVDIRIRFKDPGHTKLQLNNNELHFLVNGNEQKVIFNEKGEGVIRHRFNESNTLTILCEDMNIERTVSAYPAWVFIVPVAFLGIWVARSRFAKKESKE